MADRSVYETEMESKMDQLRIMLQTSDSEKVELGNRLEEEKWRVEELQYCVEEDAIIKQDLEVAIASEKSHVAKLEEELSMNNDEVEVLRQELMESKRENARNKELEQSLLLEKTRAETLQRELSDTKVAIASEKSHVAKLEEELAISNDEVGEMLQELMESIRENARNKELEQSLLLEKTRAETLQRELSDTKVAIASEKSHVAKLEEELAISNDELKELRQDLSLVCKSKSKEDGLRRKYQNLNSAAQIITADKEKLKAELHDANKVLQRMNLFFDKFQLSDGETVSEMFGNTEEQISQESLHTDDVELQNPHQEMQALLRSEEYKAVKNINYEKQELERNYQNLKSATQILAADKEKLKAELHEMKSQLDKLVQENLELVNSRDELVQAPTLMEKETHLLEKHHRKIKDEQISIISKQRPVFQTLIQSKEDMARKHAALNREHKITLARVQELENKVSVLLIEQKDLVRAVEALTSEKEELAEERDELASKVKDLRQENHQILVNYSKLTAEMAMVTNQLYYSEKQNEELQLTSERIRMLHTEIMMKIKKKTIKLKHVFKMLSKAQQ